MNIWLILLMVCILVLVGVMPVLIAIPLNGLTIWGQILGMLNIGGRALFVWFVVLSVLMFFLISFRLARRNSFLANHSKLFFDLLAPWFVFSIYLIANFLLISYGKVNSTQSMEKVILFALKGILTGLFSVLWLVIDKRNSILKIEKAIFAFGLVEVFFLTGVYLSGNFTRIMIFGLNPIWLARDLGISLLAALSIFKNKAMRLLAIFIMVLGIVLTRSRGPLIALAISLFAVYSHKSLKSKKYGKLAPSIVVLSLLGIISILGVGADDYFVRGESSFLEERNVSARILLYKSAWNDFLDSPVLGKGVGSFLHYGHTYPHNIVLELMAETGLLGLVLFLIALRPRSMFSFNNRFAVYMLFSLITTMFSGDLEKNAYLVAFSILSHYEIITERLARRLER